MNKNQEQERTIRNMEDAGCSEDTINSFLLCYQSNDVNGELQVLSRHRKNLLENIHKEQKKIDCLDYLVYQIEKSVKPAEKF